MSLSLNISTDASWPDSIPTARDLIVENHHHSKKDTDSVSEHRKEGLQADCLVITVSDSRTPETDRSGDRMASLLEQGGHRVAQRLLIPDEPDQIRQAVADGVADPSIDAVLTNGGTGIAPRDLTTDVVAALLDQPLDGFGELFRSLSFTEIGSAAMLSRAIGGIAGKTLIFSLPGSTKAVELGMAKLIVPELGHLLGLLRS